MKIVSLHIYPIKSLQGISLHSSKLLSRGLEFDRRWMLVDMNGLFITQRQIPQLALFSIEIMDNYLLVQSFFKNESKRIPFIPERDKLEVKVWEDVVQAIEVSKDVSQWFSIQLDQHVKLVYMPNDSKRLADRENVSSSEVVSFADAFPLLIANIASLKDLNSRLENKINIDRFRPNVVVNGGVAFEEDNWSGISIGNSKIKVVKKCARCVVVNIDPATAKKENEVLRVLSNYRTKKNHVYFGVNALVQKTGFIHVGNELKFTN